jgi:malate dehydrogenase (oxaloacetate-decarboxylating)(NADP+)
MHGDVALDGQARCQIMPSSTLAGDATCWCCEHRRRQHFLQPARLPPAATAVGPVLLGAAKPVHILTASATARIVNMTAPTVADANAAR